MNAAEHIEEIKTAADKMREQHGPDHVRHAFWNALADLLEGDIAHAELIGEGWFPHPAVLAVARAYLEAA